MRDYPNGRIPLTELVLVDGWGYLEKETARSWVAGCDEMVRRGFKRPTATKPDGMYRSFERQVYWKSVWTARGLPLNAATPGESDHGLGTGIDIYEVYQYPRAILESVMAAQGLEFNVPAELWHMRRNRITLASTDSTRIEIEDTMTPAQEALLKNVEQIVAALANSINDPARGILANADRAATRAGTAADIASNVRNLILDPTVGVLARINRIDGDSIDDAALAALATSIAAQVPAITVSARQLEQIVTAARDGATEGVKALSFVTVVS